MSVAFKPKPGHILLFIAVVAFVVLLMQDVHHGRLDEPVDVLILAGFGLVVAGLAIYVNRREYRVPPKRWRESMEQVASRVHGRVVAGPKMIFEHRGYQFRLRFNHGQHEYGPFFSHLCTSMKPGLLFPLYVQPATFFNNPPGGLTRFKAGDSEFDSRFVVFATDEEMARSVLTRDCRSLMTQIGALRDTDHLFIECDGSKFALIKDCWFQHEQDILEFVILGTRLFECILAANGIQDQD